MTQWYSCVFYSSIAPPHVGEVRVAQSLVFCVVFCRALFFCPFSLLLVFGCKSKINTGVKFVSGRNKVTSKINL